MSIVIPYAGIGTEVDGSWEDATDICIDDDLLVFDADTSVHPIELDNPLGPLQDPSPVFTFQISQFTLEMIGGALIVVFVISVVVYAFCVHFVTKKHEYRVVEVESERETENEKMSN